MNLATNLVTSVLGVIAALPRWQKRAVVFVIDLILLMFSIWIAYSLRMNTWTFWNEPIRRISLGAILLMIPSFGLSGVYKSIFRYAGSGMMAILLRAFLLYTSCMVFVFMIISFTGVPRTLGLLQPLVYFVLIAGSRVTFRFLIMDVLMRGKFGGTVRRVLVYGAGSGGQQLVSSMNSDPSLKVIGYVDDDSRLKGQKLDGNQVYFSADLPQIVERHQVTDILLALPNASRQRRREIVKTLSPLRINVKTLPQMKDIVGGKVSLTDLRPLEIEDLLGREQIAPNDVASGRTVVGKTVLVTGAGGSIGSELCRQIARIGAQKLVLFDVSEYSLYAIELELRSSRSETEIVAILGSVTDRIRLEEVFTAHKPDTVYHAAAYKHVPLVEQNPVEGIRNNVLGTFETVYAAHVGEVADFILVSTDKAVRPTNIMGASKRAAEQVVQSFAERNHGTRYSMVRFGNVLGSSGSVVPLFRRQIEAGGPITLTDSRVMRYFMTIPEAAGLVIQAGDMACGGEVFVLDMGRPIKILDLARTMVQLSGLSLRDDKNPDGDIAIVEIGLRPGEKLFEELLIGENPQKTRHARIMMAREDFMPWPDLAALLQQLKGCRDPVRATALLGNLVPEFAHRRDNGPRRIAS
ncbi:SDR family NAD(P)-dependent oxidoreductase [Altererythrobacter salegens]|uniref:SDR family NAD(P)-dependent oxidoreductase n=1 Tax=Croceibacterium salegens TaxID=1737568 RepID=A0A6I4SZC1_9SPHN|nr:nucleoside-diphosphate sugar epimerase/dehydratase [Croceibacterium salegens]MXO60570.1 SDR family NAD(P)-dependent oxidoreductase [Croceibacterium salegens]